MKNIIIFLTIFIIGYAVGNFLPINSFPRIGDKGIAGDAKLEVKLMMDNGTPLSNIEVDVGERSGPPPKGGVSVTNNKGIATFNIKPGSYFIYFNSTTFPKNLEWPAQEGPETKIQVEENTVNEKTLIFKTKNEGR